MEKERRVRVMQINVKSLKHAHHNHMNCTFEQLLKECQNDRNREYRVTDRYLKEIIEDLINDEFCERVEGQRNVFKYKA